VDQYSDGAHSPDSWLFAPADPLTAVFDNDPLTTMPDDGPATEARRTASAVRWQFVTLGGTDGPY